MSLTFDFPGFHKQFDEASCPDKLPSQENVKARSASDWECDLQDLSGDETEDEQHRGCDPMPAQQQQESDTATDAVGAAKHKRIKLETPSRAACSDQPVDSSSSGQYMPGAVLLLVVDRLCLRDAMSAACCCASWYDAIISNNSSTWEQQEKSLLGAGWPWAPFRGSKPLLLPPSLGTSPLLHLKTTLSTSKVALQYFVMRKGYEFMLAGFEDLWAALEHTQATHPAAATSSAAAGGDLVDAEVLGTTVPPASASLADGCIPRNGSQGAAVATTTAAESSHFDSPQQQQLPQLQQLQQQQVQQAPVLVGGRQLQRLVDKLAQQDWELTYSGYSAALAARCDTLALALREAWQQQQQQQFVAGHVHSPPHVTAHLQIQLGSQRNAPAAAAAVAAGPGSSSQPTAAAAAAAERMLPAAVLADCAGGILREIESVSGGRGAGELLAGEPELLLAATRRGPRPAASIALWVRLLPVWERYRRWLDLVAARCGLLGARVAAARQLAEPGLSAGRSTAGLLPHLRNKGLLLFRGHVLLAYGLRRPLQEAALWLAAAAAADLSAWRAGGGCSESDLEVLLRVRKCLTELDVADGQDEEAGQSTHAKFRRCFGALLTRQRRTRCLPACAW